MNVAVTTLLTGVIAPGAGVTPLAAGGSPAAAVIPGIVPVANTGEATPYTLSSLFTELLTNLQSGVPVGQPGIPALTAQVGEDNAKEDNTNTALPGALLPLFGLVTNTVIPTGDANVPVVTGVENNVATQALPPVTVASLEGVTTPLPLVAAEDASLPTSLPVATLPLPGAGDENILAATQPAVTAPSGQPETIPATVTFEVFQKTVVDTFSVPAPQVPVVSGEGTQQGIVVPNSGVVVPPVSQKQNAATPPQPVQPLLVPVQEETPLSSTLVAQVLADAVGDEVNAKAQPEAKPVQQVLAKIIYDSLQPGETVTFQAPVQNASIKQPQSTNKLPTEIVLGGEDSGIADNPTTTQNKPLLALQASEGTKAYRLVQGDKTVDTVFGHHHLSADADAPLTTPQFSVQGDGVSGTNKTGFGHAMQPYQTAVAAPWEQVTVKVLQASKDNKAKITVQLEPASLGKVDVRLDFSHDGKTSIVVAVDKPETLELLKQDARQLERALADAGIKTDSGSLSFNLRDGNGSQQQQFSDGAFPYQKLPYGEENEDAGMTIMNAIIHTSNRPDGVDIRV